MDSQHVAGARIAVLFTRERRKERLLAATELLAKQVAVVEELAHTVTEGSAEWWKLAHAGHCLNEADGRDYCGSCDLATFKRIRKDKEPDSYDMRCMPRLLCLGVVTELNLEAEHVKELRGAIRGLAL